MMLAGPLGIGSLIGIITLSLTLVLKKHVKSKIVTFIPSMVSILIAIALFYQGYVTIRGFEGAAYMILSVTILLFSVISLSLMKKKIIPKNRGY